MVDSISRRCEYPIPFHGPPELADAWSRFVDTYTEHGRRPYECQSAAVLESVALRQGGVTAAWAECGNDTARYTKIKHYIEDGLLSLGNLTSSQEAMRLLHKYIAARLMEQWVVVRREHGIDSSLNRQKMTDAALEDLDRRCGHALQTPAGGMLAGCLRAAYDTIMSAEAWRLSRRLHVSEEECLAQAVKVFDHALFSYEPERGASFGGYLTNGIRTIGQMRLIRFKRNPERLRTEYHGDWNESGNRAIAAPARELPLVDDRDLAARLMENLNPRERDVLERLFGLKDGQSRTYREIANDIGVSAQRVEQIAKSAIEKCRGSIAPSSCGRGPGR